MGWGQDPICVQSECSLRFKAFDCTGNLQPCVSTVHPHLILFSVSALKMIMQLHNHSSSSASFSLSHPLSLPPATSSPATSSTDSTNTIHATNANTHGKRPSSSPSSSSYPSDSLPLLFPLSIVTPPFFSVSPPPLPCAFPFHSSTVLLLFDHPLIPPPTLGFWPPSFPFLKCQFMLFSCCADNLWWFISWFFSISPRARVAFTFACKFDINLGELLTVHYQKQLSLLLFFSFKMLPS